MAELDPWHGLRNLTPARIALGRAGASLPTREVLEFAAAHAAARDAVHAELDVERLAAELEGLGLEVLRLESLAPDRETYVRRPDLGRRLKSREGLRRVDADLALIVADGLSALAAQENAVPVVRELVKSGISTAPVCVVRNGRVAIEDEIGQALGARVAVILLGERPGLGAADSLGAYLVYEPRVGRTDAERNCVSNIRRGGLAPEEAARTIQYLVTESLRRKISGVGLKDERANVLHGRVARATFI